MMDRAIFQLPGATKVLALLACLSLVQAFCIVGWAWSLAAVIANLWDAGSLIDQIPWIIVFFAAFLVNQIAEYIKDAYMDSYAFDRAEELRQSLLQRIFVTKSQVIQDNGTGNVTSSVLEGIDQVQSYFRLIFPKIPALVAIPVVILIATVLLDWVSMLILLIAFPVIIMFMIILGRYTQDVAGRQYGTYQMLSNHFVDTLRGIETLKLFGASKRHTSRIFNVSERFREATIKTLRTATLSSFVLDLLAMIATAAIAVMLGLRLLDGSMLLFPALAILFMAPEYFKPIRQFGSDFHASLDGINALKAIQGIISEETKTEDAVDVPAWNEASCLELKDVGYSYPEHQALENINMTAVGFKKYGLVGASGAGKSTLTNLLGGFASVDEGSIVLDGKPLSDLKQDGWQRQIAYIPQDPYIFHATLRDNIAFYCPSASESKVEEAARVVGLDELIAELPDGLDTIIGEGARALSGGQAQRIALARALLDDGRRILIFDEPTAHLDIETEMELKERMLPLMKDHLVFFATHRLHWLHDMDEIFILEQGHIADHGTLEELTAQEESGALSRLAAQSDWSVA